MVGCERDCGSEVVTLGDRDVGTFTESEKAPESAPGAAAPRDRLGSPGAPLLRSCDNWGAVPPRRCVSESHSEALPACAAESLLSGAPRLRNLPSSWIPLSGSPFLGLTVKETWGTCFPTPHNYRFIRSSGGRGGPE